MTKKVRQPRPHDLKIIEAPADCVCFYGEIRTDKKTGKGRLVKTHENYCPSLKRLLTPKVAEAEREAQSAEMQLALPDPVAEEHAAATKSAARKKADRLAKRLSSLG